MKRGQRKYATDADRITHNVTVTPSGCWEWNLARDSGGYGRVQINKKLRYAHRVSYEAFVGPIPDGLQLDHLCRVRHCANPKHLEPVTSRQNQWRSPIANATKTHCPRGHAYAADNTRFDSRGCRICVTCNRERCAAWRAGRSYPAERTWVDELPGITSERAA